MNEHNHDADHQADHHHEETSGGGIPKALIYIGVLVVINIVLIAVDAPFYIY
jgi:hypothetical protein